MMTKAARQHGAVPRLRFPGFDGTTVWTRTPLGKFCKVNPATDALPAEFFYIDLGSVDAGQLTSKTWISKQSAPSRAQRLLQPGDVLFQVVRPYQRNNFLFDLNDGAYVASTGYAQLRSVQSPQFLYQLLHTDTFVGKVSSKCSGSNYPAINSSDLAEIEIEHPAEAEQRKIADCLSSLDASIGAETRKLDALKAHKQGLMQQLFPAQGQRLPRQRFPGLDGKWELIGLGGKTIKVGSGVTPRGGEQTYKKAGRPFVRSQNVGWGELLLNDIAFIDDETHASFASTEVVDKDVLLNITGASIGRSAIADGRIAGGNVNQHVCIIRPVSDSLDPVFLNQFLISQLGQRQIDSFQAGGNRQGLNFAQIRSLIVPLPPTLGEQQRIASCLSSIDTLIATQSRKIAALQQHKKGLMQGLFPAAHRSATED